MSRFSTNNKGKLGKLTSVALVCLCLASCKIPAQDSSASSMPQGLPDGQLAFVSRSCGHDADVQLLALPSLDISPLLIDQKDDHMVTWSPDSQRLGVLYYEVNQQILSIVELSMPTKRVELGDFVVQIAWAKDGHSLYYLEREGWLYKYDLTRGESSQISDGVSHFSVSSDGQWLGLSTRDSVSLLESTFHVLDLRDENMLGVLDDKPYHPASGRSVWSPSEDAVAVIFGATASQPSRIVIYAVYNDYLEVKANVTARDTYREDRGDDIVSVEFSDLAWSRDGQSIFAVRSTTDAKPGGEVLWFNSDLKEHQVLPFGDSVTKLARGTNNWLAYVVARGEDDDPNQCVDQLQGEVWLADLDTLERRVVITNTLYTERPVWRP